MFRHLFIASWILASPANAAFTPVLNLIEPRGAQRGTDLDLHLYGERLDDPRQLLFHNPGIEVLSFDAKDSKHLIAHVRIAPDAPLGEHPVRLRTSGGVTFLRTLWIGQFPTIKEAVKETGEDDSFDKPQRVELNTTVQGIAKSEDEDFYSVILKKGQSLSVEVEAMRLGRGFFDAYVAILNPQHFELAAYDDAPLLYTDAYAAIVAPEDGEYRVVVREAAYEGSDASEYRLHIGSFPRPAAVFPTGARPGDTLSFQFFGDPAGEITRQITIPPDASGRFPIYAERGGISSPSPNWIQVSPIATANETEPNNSFKEANPTPPIPCALHGILTKDDSADTFRFSAKKGENLVFRILARSLRSPLDSVISIRNSKNKYLVTNDDQGGPDSVLPWPVPEDGEYLIVVTDKLGRGGPNYTYRLEIDRRAPTISATLPVFERNNSQARKMITIPRGNRYATTINITRANLACDVLFQDPALPAGVTMIVPPVPRSLNDFPVVFEAAADAPVEGGYYHFRIRATGDKAPDIAGPLREEIHHIEVNNQGPYHSTFSENIAVAVISESPYSLTLDAPAVPIVRNGVLKLKVRARRAEGYKEPITLRFLWKPPGIGTPVTIKLDGDKSEADYEINASADAPPGEWQICILGEANTPGGPVIVSSQLVPLKVADPFVNATIDLAATEQGRNTPVLCKLEQLTPFDGNARAELIGLPHGTKSTPVEFDKDAAEITFPIEVAADAAIGKHGGLFLRIEIPADGSTILHQTGQGGTLRIDKSAPKTTAATTVARQETTKPSDDKPTAKPLSRLEQLRQQAK